MTKIWDKIRLRSQEEEIESQPEGLFWEYFHENSKISGYESFSSDEEISKVMQTLHESLEFKGYRTIILPTALTPLIMSLQDAILNRASAREMSPCSLTLANVATILHYSYGITRKNINTGLIRPFRVVPSAGALYPLEIFFYSEYIKGLPTGIYHYSPTMNSIKLIDKGNKSAEISESLVQKDVAYSASLILFITAIFKRCTFKYSDRGYRFALLEAGHVAQNINLVAKGLQLGSLNLGGFYDRKVDCLLGLDGITHSTIYISAIGKETT